MGYCRFYCRLNPAGWQYWLEGSTANRAARQRFTRFSAVIQTPQNGLCRPEVTGSIPVGSTRSKYRPHRDLRSSCVARRSKEEGTEVLGDGQQVAQHVLPHRWVAELCEVAQQVVRPGGIGDSKIVLAQ